MSDKFDSEYENTYNIEPQILDAVFQLLNKTSTIDNILVYNGHFNDIVQLNNSIIISLADINSFKTINIESFIDLIIRTNRIKEARIEIENLRKRGYHVRRGQYSQDTNTDLVGFYEYNTPNIRDIINRPHISIKVTTITPDGSSIKMILYDPITGRVYTKTINEATNGFGKHDD